jgi:hypothetical protein
VVRTEMTSGVTPGVAVVETEVTVTPAVATTVRAR